MTTIKDQTRVILL